MWPNSWVGAFIVARLTNHPFPGRRAAASPGPINASVRVPGVCVLGPRNCAARNPGMGEASSRIVDSEYQRCTARAPSLLTSRPEKLFALWRAGTRMFAPQKVRRWFGAYDANNSRPRDLCSTARHKEARSPRACGPAMFGDGPGAYSHGYGAPWASWGFRPITLDRTTPRRLEQRTTALQRSDGRECTGSARGVG